MLRNLRRRGIEKLRGGLPSGKAASKMRPKQSGRLTFEPLEPRVVLNAGPLYISEILAVGDGGLVDENGDYPDWIEIHNPGEENVDLDGWHLTDDPDRLIKWDFPDVTIEAGGYLTVFASGKDRSNPGSPLHTDFRLDSSEYLALVHPDGGTISHEFAPAYPEQVEGFSFGAPYEKTELLSEGTLLSFLVPDAQDAALETTWTDPTFDDSDWGGLPHGSPVLITEADPDNPDWFEIQNVSNFLVDTSGWVVVVNYAKARLPGDEPFEQYDLSRTFESGSTLDAHEVLYMTDDPNDNPLVNGTNPNIFWQGRKVGWVMIVDDEGAIVDFTVWGYSDPGWGELFGGNVVTEAEIKALTVRVNNQDVTVGDAWSGPSIPLHVDDHTLTRIGNLDHNDASDFEYSYVPPGSHYSERAGVQNAGLVLPFPGTAPPARTGLGYHTGPTGFVATLAKTDEPIDSLVMAEAILADRSRQTATDTEIVPFVNYWNTGSRAHYSSDRPFPRTTAGVNVDRFVFEATATVIIPEAGPWSFGVNSDEGFRLELSNGVDTYEMSYPENRESTDTIATFQIAMPGSYSLRLVTWENEGGAEVELFAARGTYSIFSSAFDLVGDTAKGGLAVSGLGSTIRADVEAEMRGVNSSVYARVPFTVDEPIDFDSLVLRMKYSDGFVAYLNGVEVARRNAPASPQWNSSATAEQPLNSTAQFENINISQFIDQLHVGENLMAIHALSRNTNDTELFVLPEIVGTKFLSEGSRFFVTPTPGQYNVEGFYGFIADTKFSVDRGIYQTAQTVAITTDTPGATIRYTTNGSEPTERNGMTYTGPLGIRKTTTLRAVAFKEGYYPTDIDTQTYIFLSDVLLQSPTGQRPTPEWPGSSVNGQSIVYGMDPDIVTRAPWKLQMIDALESLPTMSLVTDLDNLFGSKNGIFVNARSDGPDWERPASLELIYPPNAEGLGFPDGADEGFQINAGVRIRGGYSRSGNNPKHAFRFFFRDEYGDSKLNYPLFGDEGVDKFDKVDLRTSQNYSWAFGGPNNNTMVREVFSRDLQGEMEQPYTRSRYYHLYVNGQYWGIFQTQERSEARYASSNFGGEVEDWDIIKQNDSRQISATDGNLDAYRRLWSAVSGMRGSTAAYYRAQGMNPDGTRNPAYERMLDVDNLIDYMIITYYTGDRDGPGSRYTTPNVNNYYAAYNRENPDGWKFFEHDSEHSLGTGEQNMVSPLVSGHSSRRNFTLFNAHWLHEQLTANPEYKQRFADRVYKHFYNDGVLTRENALERLDYRADQIRLAMIAESARWGDTKSGTPKTQLDWEKNVYTNSNSVYRFITSPDRITTVLGQIRAVGWYGSLNAPVLSRHGGEVDPGFELRMTGSGGDIYYMLDGSDPRAIGGRLHSEAIRYYSGALIPLNQTTVVKARTLSGAIWSPLAEAQFLVGETASTANLAVAELNYNPYDPTPEELATQLPTDDDFQGADFEFVELLNISDTAVDLTGVRLTHGILFDFDAGDVHLLAAGESVVVVHNLDAFKARYGDGILVAGPFQGSLNNGGDRIRLLDHTEATILDFEYNDSGSWPGRADGTGSSLEILDPAGDYNLADNWRSSSEYGGSPGFEGVGPRTDLVVNEVLTHTDLPDEDAIELHNTTGAPIDIGGWYLSDDNNEFDKFVFPAGTTIPAGAYVVFYETQFSAGGSVDFALNGAHGDDVWLVETDDEGRPTAFVQHVEFGAAWNGESLGRWPDTQGSLYPMENVTLGEANDVANNGPRVGPVVISEVMFNPNAPIGAADPGEFEFIEIFNPTGQTFDLANWRIRGTADYDFESGTMLGSGDVLTVVPFDPADAVKVDAFRTHYEIGEEIVLVGPYSDRLGDDGGRVTLRHPDSPPADEPTFYPRILEDELIYGDTDPWPTTPDGEGDSLNRVDADLWGHEVASWTAGDPTPGSVDLSTSSRHPGDANLDGTTDVRDFMIWNLHKFTSGTTWTEGDFDDNGVTDVRDFMIWNTHKFTSAPVPPPVDAIFEQAAEQDGPIEAASSDDMALLSLWQAGNSTQRTTDAETPAEAAVDKLLATYWP